MPGRQQEFSDQAFLADFKGLYDQHAAMWPIYIDSIKILVTVSSAPLLGLAAVLAAVKPDATALKTQDLTQVIGSPALAHAVGVALIIICLIDLLLLGVVIHHRLAILLYARGLNGYRKIYTQHFGRQRLPGIQWPFPLDPAFPENYEWRGPMGLIVTACSLVNGCYAWLAFSLLGASMFAQGAAFLIALISYHWWYWWSCVNRSRQQGVETGAPAGAKPTDTLTPWYAR